MTAPGWLAFLALAGFGASTRYLVDRWIAGRSRGVFPWGTLAVNVSGCVLLGVVTGFGIYHGLGDSTRTVVGSGGLGAYTTFSTFTYESVRLVEEGAVDHAFRNTAANLVVGLAAAALGLAVAAAV